MTSIPQFDYLRCPATGGRLQQMDAELLARLQRAVEAGAVVNRAGRLVTDVPPAAIVCHDAGVAYPCRDSIPVLIADKAIDLGQLAER